MWGLFRASRSHSLISALWGPPHIASGHSLKWSSPSIPNRSWDTSPSSFWVPPNKPILLLFSLSYLKAILIGARSILGPGQHPNLDLIPCKPLQAPLSKPIACLSFQVNRNYPHIFFSALTFALHSPWYLPAQRSSRRNLLRNILGVLFAFKGNIWSLRTFWKYTKEQRRK